MMTLKLKFIFFLIISNSLFAKIDFCSEENLDKKSIESKINTTYPHQNFKVVKKRIAAASNSFLFFRSFVPYYYALLRDCSSDEFKELMRFKGTVIGDPHPINFGSIIIKKSGKNILSFNDPDDGGPGYLVADIVRYLSSLRIFLKTYGQINYKKIKYKILNSYLRGLRGSKILYSTSTNELLDTNFGKFSPNSKWVDLKNNRFAMRKPYNYDLNTEELEILRNIIKDKYQSELLDSYGFKKYTGGSGGLNRYESLIRSKNGEVNWLEFKETPPAPGIFTMASAPLLNTADNYMKNIRLQQGQSSLKFYRILNIGSVKYLSRFRFSGNRGYNLEKKDSENNKEYSKRLIQIVIDQSFIIGKIHRKSLGKKKSDDMALSFKSRDVQEVILQNSRKLAKLLTSSFWATRTSE